MITPDPTFKLLGLLSIIIVWTGLLFLLYKWRGNRSMSFSLHAAQTKSGQIYYFFLFIIVLPLFYLFIIKWLAPTLNLNNNFTYLIGLGVVGQLLAVLVPALPGRRMQIHNFGAYLMAFTMIPVSLFIAFATVPFLVSLVAALGAIYMVVATILLLTVKRSHAYYLYFQAAYIATFHVIILLSSYTA
jgi:hypothetical protein